MVRRRAEIGLEASLSHNTGKHQIGESSIGAQCMVSHAQSVVEVPHGYSRGLVGSGGGAEQAKEATCCASLGRIRVDHSREETGGFQRDGHGTLGKSPNFEIDPNYGFGEEMRCTSELQRGYPGHSEAHDNLEAGMGGIQGSFKEDGVVYGGSSGNEY